MTQRQDNIYESAIDFLATFDHDNGNRLTSSISQFVTSSLNASRLVIFSHCAHLDIPRKFTKIYDSQHENLPFSRDLFVEDEVMEAVLSNGANGSGHYRFSVDIKNAQSIASQIENPSLYIIVSTSLQLSTQQYGIIKKTLSKICRDSFRTSMRILGEMISRLVRADRSLYRVLRAINSQILVQYLNAEAASIFIFDKSKSSLVLAASSGIEIQARQKLKRTDINYHIDSQSWTARCFSTGKIEYEYSNANGDSLKKNYFGEDVTRILSRIYIPIRSWNVDSNDPTGRVVGVIRTINTNHDQGCHYLTQTETVRYCTLSGLLAHIIDLYSPTLSLDQLQEQATHGFDSDLNTITLSNSVAINWLTRLKTDYLASTEKIDPTIYQSIIQTEEVLWAAAAAQDNMSSQIKLIRRNFDSSQSIWNEKDQLPCSFPFRDVISPIIDSLELKCKYHGRSKPTVTFFGKQRRYIETESLPALDIMVGEFYLIVNNILTNSVKYSKINTQISIDISWYVSGSYINFTFTDLGIGVDKKDAAYIFDIGYRSRAAVNQDPTGHGIGLSVCRDIARSRGGEIVLDPASIGSRHTSFVVKMPIKKDLDPWRS